MSGTVRDMTVTYSNQSVWARRVREVRGAESQEAFAHRIGVSVATISRIERGKAAPRWGTALRLAAATSRPVSFFLGEDAEEEERLQVGFLDRFIAELSELRASTGKSGVVA